MAAVLEKGGVVLILTTPRQVTRVVFVIRLQGKLRKMILHRQQVVDEPEECPFPSP
jgi:hypothetical protein